MDILLSAINLIVQTTFNTRLEEIENLTDSPEKRIRRLEAERLKRMVLDKLAQIGNLTSP